MASHKNQHYVPRCLLKRFTRNSEGKAINLFNIAANKFIPNAAVKNQCSKNFFYGADLEQEKALADLEGQFVRVMESIEIKRALSDDDIDWLNAFTIIQTRRTAQAVQRLKQFNDRMADEVFKKNPEQRPPDLTHDELVLMSMLNGLDMARHIDDLKLIFLENETDLEFSISDHPAVLNNRFNFERSKIKGFGLASSGTFLVLPVSPRLVVFLFDILVYSISIPRGSRFVPLKSRSDVAILNELQQLNAEENIYFSSWPEREQFIARDAHIAEQRALAPRIQTLVRDQNAPGRVFREGSNEELAAAKQALIHVGSQHARPKRWPTFLKMRKEPTTYSDGSMAGHVRKAAWLRQGALD